MGKFSFSDYIMSAPEPRALASPEKDYKDFYSLCSYVKDAFYKDWDAGDNTRSALEIQKKAILGYEQEKDFFKTRITEIAVQKGALDTVFPPWYDELSDAVYHENWGLAGLSEWFCGEYLASSSAKIVSGRIYFLSEGKMKLMPQSISRKRLDQLIKAFLLASPRERLDKSYHETYLLDGTRVTIYTEPMTKTGQPAIVFRRYLIPKLSFEEQALRGTIPKAAIPLFKVMVDIGFNVVFIGAVRTAKTTFLSTWQSHEDPALEGVLVETDPEIPMHKILPSAPIIQLIADGEELKGISKNLLRSDADYFILAEARDGIALDTAVRLASKGTKRMKMTFHSRRPTHFALEAATEIVKATGGDLKLTMQMVASSFDYIFHFVSFGDRSVKRLDSIFGMGMLADGTPEYRELCRFDPASEKWTFKDDIAPFQAEYAERYAAGSFSQMRGILGRLAAMPVGVDSIFQ